MNERRLIFVYNADSGLLNSLKDAVHKAFSPSTYPCRLCGLTFGAVSMKPVWRGFVEGLDLPVEFLHRDEFRERYNPEEVGYPSAYVEENGFLRAFISMDEMNRLDSLEELMDLVEDRLKEKSHFPS
jgi:hypothetical protein